MENCHKHTTVLLHSSFIVSVKDNYPSQHKFSLEGWMSAICSDFPLNLGNVWEHVFSLFLIPSLILGVLWLSTVTT